MLVKRVDLPIEMKKYNDLKDYFFGKTLHISIDEEISFEIEGTTVYVNFYFDSGFFYFNGRTDTNILFEKMYNFKRISILINVYEFEFKIHKHQVKLFVNLDKVYDGIYFDNIVKFYISKMHILKWKVYKNDYEGLYNYLIYADFSKNLDVVYSCYVLNLYFNKIGLTIETEKFAKLFFEKLEYVGIIAEKVKDIIKNKSFNIKESIDNIMNTPTFIDDSSFNEVLFTLIGTAIVYADEGHDIEYPIFDYISSLPEDFYYSTVSKIFKQCNISLK